MSGRGSTSARVDQLPVAPPSCPAGRSPAGADGGACKVSVLRKDGKPVLDLLVTQNFPTGRRSVYNQNSVDCADG